ERGAAAGAVAAAAGGQAQRRAAGEQRAAAVPGLRADRGLDQPGHGPLGADARLVERGVGAALHVRRDTAALDRLTSYGVARGGDVLGGAVVEVHRPRVVGVAAAVLDDGVVVAGEAAARGAAQEHRVAGVGVPAGGDVAAVPGGEEVVRAGAAAHVEAER